MVNYANIRRFFKVSNQEEGRLLLDRINLKMRELISSVASLDILPSRIKIFIHPDLYEPQAAHDGHHQKTDKKSYVVVVELDMEFYTIHHSTDCTKQHEEGNRVIEKIDELSVSSKGVGNRKSILYKEPLLNDKAESTINIQAEADSIHDARISARDQIFNPILSEVDFRESPVFEYVFKFHSLLKDQIDGQYKYTLKGKMQKIHYLSKEHLKVRDD